MDNLAWIATSHSIGWNIVSNHRTGTDDGIFANGDTLEDNASGANEGIAADMDRGRLAITSMALVDVGREAMPVAVGDECAGSDHGIVIDGDALVADDRYCTHAHMITDADLCRGCLCADA